MRRHDGGMERAGGGGGGQEKSLVEISSESEWRLGLGDGSV